MDPLVSVIIPIRRGEDISLIIKSIQESTYRIFEIIIVDEGLERSAQRNTGIARAQGKYLLILDSDQAVSSGLLKECVEIAKRTDCDGIYIPEKIKTKGMFAYIRDWERNFYTGTYVDCVRFVKARGCPKFDETMSGPEDSDWDRRIGPVRFICYSPIYHYDNIGVIKYFTKKAYYAESLRRYSEKWPNDPVLKLRYRCFTVFTENGKWILLLMRPDLTLAVMFILLIRGVIYLWKK